ncbi:MAG: HEAT repeat domain-containing protein [Eudoraea sp.]|nr:HEAT repeat domain-containing protein [Eudoraea sp.]
MNKLVFTYQSFTLISVPKIHTDLLWDLSVLFGSLCILYFAFIFFFRNRLSAKAQNINDRRKQLTPIISNFLFYGEDASKEEKYEYIELKVEMREFIKDPINRSVLKEILLDLQRDLTGDARLRLLSLYQDFDLHLDAYQKLNSWRWEVVTKGIVELTQMQVEPAYTFIKKFINHKRSVIRKQAQIAAVSLKHEGIAHFLDTNKYAISEWQQIKILEVLQEQEDFIPPTFGAWLTSKNKDVVLFSLRLIRHYNQTDANSSVTELLKHKDDEVKQAAIECIKEFGIKEAIPLLMAAFKRSKQATKISILDALGALGSDDIIPYLREIYKKEFNFNVKSKALSSINVISPNTVLPEENLDPAIKVTSEKDASETEIEKETPIEIESKEVGQPLETIEEEVVITEEGSELFLEDLDVFEYCFMEELNEILDHSDIEDTGIEVKYLPLDFLPIVVQKQPKMAKKKLKRKQKKKQSKKSDSKFRMLDVSYEEVHPEEGFRKELEDILSRVEVPDLEGNIEVEYLNFKFLPFVVNEEGVADKLPALLEEINALEVNGVEIVLPEPIEEDTVLTEEETSAIDAVESETDTCSMVDWETIEEEEAVISIVNGVENPPTEESIVQLDVPAFGFSIFEELFRHCDTESKLILLDEILELGDEKELCFLKTLSKETNGDVRKKAKNIASRLTQKLRTEQAVKQTPDSIVKWADTEKEKPSISLNFDLDDREIKKINDLRK